MSEVMSSDPYTVEAHEDAVKERRIKLVRMTESNIMGLLDGSIYYIGFPNGCRFLRAFYDPYSNCICVAISHHSFAPIAESEPMPYYNELSIKVNYSDPTQED